MIVPTTISPIDYLKDTNEYVFYLEDFILKIDNTNQRFELMTTDDLAYFENFDFIKNPPEWFEVIDPGLVGWIRKAINWHELVLRNDDQYTNHKLDIDGIAYEFDYNSRTRESSTTPSSSLSKYCARTFAACNRSSSKRSEMP